MARIIEIIGVENNGNHANIHVLLDDGTEGVVWVGGKVDVHFDDKHNKIKVFVKRA